MEKTAGIMEGRPVTEHLQALVAEYPLVLPLCAVVLQSSVIILFYPSQQNRKNKTDKE